MDALKPFVDAATSLRRFTARAGLVLWTFILYADVFAYFIWKLPLLDAMSGAPRDGRTLALVALGISLYPVLMAAAARSARIVYYWMLVMLDEIGNVLPGVQVVSRVIERLFHTKRDVGCSSRRWGRSERLLARALSGVGPALELYNQRNRAMLDDLERADESLSLLVVLLANRLMVNPHGFLSRAWANAPAGNASVIVGLLAVVVMWMLACQGLHPGELPRLELDLDSALRSEEEPPKDTRRPGD